MYRTGTKITCRETGAIFIVTASDATETKYQNATQKGQCPTASLAAGFEVDGASIGPCLDIQEPAAAPAVEASALDVQEGGDHYRKYGPFQPMEVLSVWLSPEELKGFAKGSAIYYLMREHDKDGVLDIKKAIHTLQCYLEVSNGR